MRERTPRRSHSLSLASFLQLGSREIGDVFRMDEPWVFGSVYLPLFLRLTLSPGLSLAFFFSWGRAVQEAKDSKSAVLILQRFTNDSFVFFSLSFSLSLMCVILVCISTGRARRGRCKHSTIIAHPCGIRGFEREMNDTTIPIQGFHPCLL